MFTGYYQIICANGHYICRDIYETDVNSTEKLRKFICPLCHTPIAWFNLVSETEGEENGYVHIDQLKKVELAVCPTCQCNRVVKHPIYRIPEGLGVDLRDKD